MLARTRFLGHVRLMLAIAFAVAVASVWNDLPPEVVMADLSCHPSPDHSYLLIQPFFPGQVKSILSLFLVPFSVSLCLCLTV